MMENEVIDVMPIEDGNDDIQGNKAPTIVNLGFVTKSGKSIDLVLEMDSGATDEELEAYAESWLSNEDEIMRIAYDGRTTFIRKSDIEMITLEAHNGGER